MVVQCNASTRIEGGGMAVAIEVTGDNLEQEENSNTYSFPQPEPQAPSLGSRQGIGKIRRAPVTTKPRAQEPLTWSSV